MLPSKTDPRWKLLVSGKTKHKFSSFSGSMLIDRLSRSLVNDSSPASISKCINEAYTFFQKYETLFVNDLKTIFH